MYSRAPTSLYRKAMAQVVDFNHLAATVRKRAGDTATYSLERPSPPGESHRREQRRTWRSASETAKAEAVRTGDAFAKRTQSFELFRSQQWKARKLPLQSSHRPEKRGPTGGGVQLATEAILSVVKAVEVDLIDENGGSPGVRLRKSPKPKR